ncbi:HesA/MoeB/ThiF family protein [Pseudomonas sp. GM30]|uniref:HesA/MoeB/ThiF family protein n=1 Tax=Pseudomonas sp. GM30 TaxID=1144328 RepID=UPI00026FE240|nr:ThiF family adenylyltransferase [Pseudomonas sp. GM30]EUB87091.1 UBA/THIF-type NAD/FAD binding protein [Pseudomonas sp. GM30]
MKLSLKPTIIPFKLDGQVVLRFNGQYAKIPDPHGAVWAFVRALDGHTPYEALITQVAGRYPGVDQDEIRSVAQDLIKYRLVESPDAFETTSLSDHDRTRFSRNIDFFGSMAAVGENKFTHQEKLRAARVCVLGCGGLGTHILFDLVALGVHHLTILDFDTIELSNLNRQILYKETDVGMPKVATARRRLLEFNSHLDITAHETRLQSAQDVAGIVRGHDIVICVADKPANYMADWLNEACVEQGVPFISGGLDVRRSVFYSVVPGSSGCGACWLTSARNKSSLVNSVSTMAKQHDITYEHPGPALVTLVAVTAGMMVSETVKIITGCQPPQLTNKLKEFTFDDLDVSVAEVWQQNPDCTVCGHLANGQRSRQAEAV